MLEFQGVTYRPDAASVAVQDLSFGVAPGEWLALMGANGSGKSTVAKLACGILRPSSGKIRAPRTGYVAQDPEANVVGESVFEDVGFGLAKSGVPRERIRLEVERALRRMGVADLKDRTMRSLSGGEVQRVAVAAALADGADVLVLDEPTSHLPRAEAVRFVRDLRAAVAETGLAVLYVTHHPQEARLADRLALLVLGRLAAEGPPEALLHRMDLLGALGVRFDPLLCLERLRTGQGGTTGEPSIRSVRDGDPTSLASRLGFKGARPIGDTPAILLEDVTIMRGEPSERSPRKAIENLRLSVHAGEAVALLGANGAGKSSALLAIAGLIDIAEGRARILGRDVREAARKDPVWFRRRVGFAMQFPERSFFAATVADELAFTARRLQLPASERDKGVSKALELVGIPEAMLDRSPFGLSGGEKRKVALAAAVAHGPSVLLLDEPEAGLDWRALREVAAFIRNFAGLGGTILVATHDVAWALSWADTCVVLEHRTVRDTLSVTVKKRDPVSLAAEIATALGGRLSDLGRLAEVWGKAAAEGLDLPFPYRDEALFLRSVNTIGIGGIIVPANGAASGRLNP